MRSSGVRLSGGLECVGAVGVEDVGPGRVDSVLFIVSPLSGPSGTRATARLYSSELLMTRRVNLYRWDQLPLDKVTEMVTRKVIASRDLNLIQAYFKKGALVPLHAHAADL